jgi:hypothetical protein
MNNIFLLIIVIAIAVFISMQVVNGQEWNSDKQIVGPLENFTRTTQNGTQYNCQQGSAGKVIGCTLIMAVHGQEWNSSATQGNSTLDQDLNKMEQQTETTTYNDCFTGYQATILVAIIFSLPESELSILTLADPQVKQFISDLCHFYHEKTGIWFTGNPTDEYEKSMVEKYGDEFFQTHTAPQALKKLGGD